MNERPWGNFEVLARGKHYQVKRLIVLPKKRLSLQRHRWRSEHWVVVRGEAKVTVGSDERIVKEGGHVFIAKGDVHRLENPKEQKLIVIEVQLGEYLREDDIERLSDDFGRA